MMKMNEVKQFVEEQGLVWSPDCLIRLNQFLEILMEESKAQRIIGTATPEEIVTRHFLDSLQVCRYKSLSKDFRVMDFGSGGGFPGIPLAIAFPEARMDLLEVSRKRATFLRKVKLELSLSRVEILEGRAEELAHRKEYREVYDLVLARAVSPLPALLELTMPFLRPGGELIAWKGEKLEQELEDSQNAFTLLGAKPLKPVPYTLGPEGSSLRLIPIQKVSETDTRYPRRSGIPQKRPL